jgi:DNA-binding MarR family transcriptional regulator
MTLSILDAALHYRSNGISVIPIDPQTKRPYWRLLPKNAEGKGAWKQYQTASADEATIRQWFTGTDAGIAAVCGAVSGNLLILDFDVSGFFEAWQVLAGELADGLPAQRTGGGGQQVLLRCPEPGRNVHLAWSPDESEDTGREIAIETRSEGGYAVLAPSLHPSGNRYVSLVDDLAAIPTISQARADALLAAARKLDEAPKTREQIEGAAKVHTAPRADLNGQASVIDAYNQAVTITDLLEDHKYTKHGDGYARPDGSHKSVTIDDNKSFHHNTNDPLANGYWHDAFDVYCQMKHAGDIKKAVKAAAEDLDMKLETHGTKKTTSNIGANSPQSGVPKLLHADQLDTLPKSPDLIPGFLSLNTLHQVFGRAGAGKSFLNLDIALSVAQYANVVYLAAEDAERYPERIHAWREHHQAGTGDLFFWPEPVNLLNPDAVSTFLAEVNPLEPALIVVDTLQSCMVGADENSTRDMGLAIEALNTIRRQTTAAILICHHTGWSDTHERGNSALRAACRLVMKLSQSDDGLITLSCEKTNSAKFEPRYFRLLPVGDSRTVVPSSKLMGRDMALTEKHFDLLEALSLAIFAGGATHSQLVEHLDMPKSTVNKGISKLLGLGYVEASDGRYKQYTLTSTGKHELQSHFFSTASSPRVHSEFTGSSELALNWAIAAPQKTGGEFTESSLETPHSNAVVHPVHPEFTDSSLNPELFTSPSPPYKGDGVNSEQVEHGKEDVKPSETSPPGAVNIEYVRERLAAEDYKAIYRHCQVNRLDYDAVLEKTRAVTT